MVLKGQKLTKVYAVHQEGDINLFTEFYISPCNSIKTKSLKKLLIGW